MCSGLGIATIVGSLFSGVVGLFGNSGPDLPPIPGREEARKEDTGAKFKLGDKAKEIQDARTSGRSSGTSSQTSGSTNPLGGLGRGGLNL